MALAAAVQFAVATAPRADDLSLMFEPRSLVSVGGLVGTGPRFQGARQNGWWGLPYLSVRGPDEARAWWSPDDALDVSFVSQERVQAGLVVDLREARSIRDDRRLLGLPQLPLAPAAGIFGEIWPVAERLRLRAEVTQGLRNRDGIIVKLGADVVARFDRFTLSGGPRLVVADAAAARLDFDVPVSATVSNPLLTPYRAASGPRSIGVTGAISYDVSEAWQLLAYSRYDRLVATAAASPITRRIGTPNAVTIGSGLVHTFAFGQ